MSVCVCVSVWKRGRGRWLRDQLDKKLFSIIKSVLQFNGSLFEDDG